MQDANLPPMTKSVDSPRNTRRRAKLQALVSANGGLTAVALELDTPKTHLSAILNGKRGVGDALAGRIEALFGLPPGGLDEEESQALPDILRTLNDLILGLIGSGKMHLAEVESYVATLRAREAAGPATVPKELEAEAARLFEAAMKAPEKLKDLVGTTGVTHEGKEQRKGRRTSG